MHRGSTYRGYTYGDLTAIDDRIVESICNDNIIYDSKYKFLVIHKLTERSILW